MPDSQLRPRTPAKAARKAFSPAYAAIAKLFVSAPATLSTDSPSSVRSPPHARAPASPHNRSIEIGIANGPGPISLRNGSAREPSQDTAAPVTTEGNEMKIAAPVKAPQRIAHKKNTSRGKVKNRTLEHQRVRHPRTHPLLTKGSMQMIYSRGVSKKQDRQEISTPPAPRS